MKKDHCNLKYEKQKTLMFKIRENFYILSNFMKSTEQKAKVIFWHRDATL